MKHKLQTLLKHKLQWLLLLAALLGVSQGLWAGNIVYLKPWGDWLKDGANLCVRFCGSSGNDCRAMTQIGSTGVYYADINSCTTFQFIRCGTSGCSTDAVWNYSNQLSYSASANYWEQPNSWDNWGSTGSYYNEFAIRGLDGDWNNNKDFNSSGNYEITINDAGAKEFKLYKKSGTWYGNGQIIIIGNTQTISGTNGSNCKLYSINGVKYRFHFEGVDDSGNPRITVTQIQGVPSQNSNLYIKGPLCYFNNDCWTYSSSSYSVSSSVWTIPITASTQSCSNAQKEFVLSKSNNSSDDNANILNGRYKFVADGDSPGWTYSTRSGYEHYFKCTLSYSAGDNLTLILTWDDTNKQYKMKVAPSCTPPSSSYFSVTNNMFTYDGSDHYATVNYSGTPAAYAPTSVTATYGSGKASSVSAAGEYDIYVSASGASSTYCDVTDLKLTGEGQKLIICTPPTPGFSASADQSNLYFSNGYNVSTTLSTAANSNWDFQWVCTQKPTYGATTYSPTITSSTSTSNSTTVTFPIEGVYKFKVKAKCKSDNEDAWVESTEVTVTVHLKLHLKGPITCSACAFTGDCETYTAICDLTNTNTVTYNFMGYYKNNADYKGEFCINASNSAGDGNHIHTSDTYTDNNLNLTAGITYNTSHNYNLMSDGLTIAETGTQLSLTITHTGGKNYTLSLALLNCPDISIKTHPSPTAQTLCKNGSPTNLTVEGQGGTTPYTYQWYQNSERATSGATMVSGATSATITPATTANGTLYYYCVVSSAGFCSDKKATSNMSGGVTVATPKLTASATSVTNFTPVVITSDVVLNNTKFTITDVQSTDSYLYENTIESVIFKGDVGNGSSKIFTISGTARDVSCTGTVDITVSKDANSCD